jgi:hypothetical protein
MEFAETWFEIQDLLTEDPGAAQEKIRDFERGLDTFQREGSQRLEKLENAFDREPSRSYLEEIFKECQAQTYVASLRRDLDRFFGK